MKMPVFGVERWMDTYETGVTYNLGETCVDSITLGELLNLTGRREEILSKLLNLRLSYGHITGNPDLKEQVASLYEKQGRENVLVMNGGSAANYLALTALAEPGKRVVATLPSYQQHYSIPEALGAEVSYLWLREERGFLPDPDELRRLAEPGVDLICLCNPNNPTGSLMEASLLEEIVEIAKEHHAWLFCDEVYRGLAHEEGFSIPSVADLYEKGISTGSMSKVYSLAGIRTGWIVASPEFLKTCELLRDYTTISCAQMDEILAALALEHRKALLERNLPVVHRGAAALDAWVQREPRVRYVKPRGGTTAFLHFGYALNSEDFCKELLKRYGVLLVPGSCFGMEHWYRLGYAYSPRVLEEGLQKISLFFRDLESRGL
jgi:aspartate/methionine/tyrosine aminotransferase